MVKELVAGGIVTLVIGGATYTVSQKDVVDNFANDTGLSQQQAEQYVNNVNEEDLIPYDELGNDFIDDGNTIVATAKDIDCVGYTYEWESVTLSCETGKAQLLTIGNDEISLGKSYIKLSTDSASKSDISSTVNLLTKVNSNFSLAIVSELMDPSAVEESKKSNSYNKASLEAALQSDQ